MLDHMSRHSNIPEMKWAAIYLTGPRVRQTYFAPIEYVWSHEGHFIPKKSRDYNQGCLAKSHRGYFLQ